MKEQKSATATRSGFPTHLLAGLLTAAALASPTAFGQTKTWVGEGYPNANWSVSANWSPSGPPPIDGTTHLIFQNLAPEYEANSNISVNRNVDVASLTFTATQTFNLTSNLADLTSKFDMPILSMEGSGTLRISDGNANRYFIPDVGELDLTNGTFILGAPSVGLRGGFASSEVNFSGSNTATLISRLFQPTAFQMGALSMTDGTFNFNIEAPSSNSGTIAVSSLSGGGTNSYIQLTDDSAGGANLNIATVAAADTSFAGTIRNNNATQTLGITVSGDGGVQELTGTNLYTGATAVTGGILVIGGNGSINSTSGITVSDGALIQNSSVALTAAITWTGGDIGGSGTIDGNLIASGLGEKTLLPGSSPGVLSVTGDVELDDLTTMLIEINGTTVGSQYDQLAVGGALNLDSTVLDIALGYAPAINDNFLIATYDSLTGTFLGLNEGDTFIVDGTEMLINYNTDSISLTVVPEPATMALTFGFLILGITVLRRVGRR